MKARVAVHRRQREQARRRRAQGATRRARRSPRPTARLARTKLVAPIDGVVQQTAVTTVGQVVTTGQQLAVITPSGGKLQVEALVANLDIGFVKLGQDGGDQGRRLPVHPLRRAARQGGARSRPAPIAEQEAKRALANAAAAANVGAAARRPRPGQPESFVFPVTVALDATAMKIDGDRSRSPRA